MAKNQRNNKNNQNGGYRNNDNHTNKAPRKPRVNPNEIKASLCLPEDIDETISSEILEVLENNDFGKISIPLSAYRNSIDDNADADDNRITTVGYIRRFDSESCEFTVIVFNNFIDIIKSWDNVAIEPLFITGNDHLKIITKFNIIPFTTVVGEPEEIKSEEESTSENDETVTESEN